MIRLHFRSPQLHVVCRLQAEHLDKGPIALESGEKWKKLKTRIMHTRQSGSGAIHRGRLVFCGPSCVYMICVGLSMQDLWQGCPLGKSSIWTPRP